MSEVATHQDIKEVRKDIDGVLEVLKTFMHQTDDRFNRLEKRIDEFDKKLERLTNTIDGFIARFDHYETEMAARDAQFKKLLVWARKVSKKTGIPLENI